MRERLGLPTVLAGIGAALLALGVGLYSLPAALIVLGLLLLALAIVAAVRGGYGSTD